jgi:hypothetical protein
MKRSTGQVVRKTEGWGQSRNIWIPVTSDVGSMGVKRSAMILGESIKRVTNKMACRGDKQITFRRTPNSPFDSRGVYTPHS